MILSIIERQRLFEQIVAEQTPEPWEYLLQDKTIREIAVIGPGDVFVRRNDATQLERIASVQFDDEQHLVRVINKILALVSLHVDAQTPFAQVQMPDGSYVRAVVDTLGIHRSVLLILKPDRKQ